MDKDGNEIITREKQLIGPTRALFQNNFAFYSHSLINPHIFIIHGKSINMDANKYMFLLP